MEEVRFLYSFNFGAKVEILGEGGEEYEVLFVDSNSGEKIHSSFIQPGYWTKTSKEYFIDYLISIYRGGKKIHEHKFDLSDKKVYIDSSSKALGDNICWAPVYDEFRKANNCDLYVRSPFSFLLSGIYPDINWLSPSDKPGMDFYASYSMSVGIDNETHSEGVKKLNKFYNKKTPVKYIKNLTFYNQNIHREHPMLIPMQKIACNCLGLDYREIRPIYKKIREDRPLEHKYVCISEFASAGGMKIWNNKIGWQTLVDEIQKLGIKVISISKEKSSLKNIIKRNGNYDLQDRIWYLKHAEFFIGMPSGLSWLNWAVGKKTVMVGGFSEDWFEFQEDNIRAKNYSACTGCFNSEKHADKLCCFHETFCPEGKNFECSRKISPKMIIDLISENGLI